jgi:hypothetical protein
MARIRFLSIIYSDTGGFKCRTCRFGHGTEETEGAGNTPGISLSKHPYFEVTESGFKKLRMKRNHSKLNQTPVDLLQSWRGNCDVQIMVYESDPNWPDLSEIAKVTDYMVGYACKGGQTTKQEKEQIAGLIGK